MQISLREYLKGSAVISEWELKIHFKKQNALKIKAPPLQISLARGL